MDALPLVFFFPWTLFIYFLLARVPDVLSPVPARPVDVADAEQSALTVVFRSPTPRNKSPFRAMYILESRAHLK